MAIFALALGKNSRTASAATSSSQCTGSMSRLVYDVATSRLYVSAHYKWREGYNPWFEVTGVPNRPI